MYTLFVFRSRIARVWPAFAHASAQSRCASPFAPLITQQAGSITSPTIDFETADALATEVSLPFDLAAVFAGAAEVGAEVVAGAVLAGAAVVAGAGAGAALAGAGAAFAGAAGCA